MKSSFYLVMLFIVFFFGLILYGASLAINDKINQLLAIIGVLFSFLPFLTEKNDQELKELRCIIDAKKKG